MPKNDEQKDVASCTFNMLTTLVILAHSEAGRLRSRILASPTGEALTEASNRGKSPVRRRLFRSMTRLDEDCSK